MYLKGPCIKFSLGVKKECLLLSLILLYAKVFYEKYNYINALKDDLFFQIIYWFIMGK